MRLPWRDALPRGTLVGERTFTGVVMLEQMLALAKTAGGSESGARFLERVAGPAADEVGLMLQERMRLVRLERTLRWSARARELLERAGLEGGADIPLRTLFPLLEGASLEEDESLGEMWASLIANAAAYDPTAVPPSFPKILQELSPADAVVLQAFNAHPYAAPPRALERGGPPRGVLIGEIANAVEDSHDSQPLRLSIGNLMRLGLVERDKASQESSDEDGYFRSEPSWMAVTIYRLTPLGLGFLTACRPPLAEGVGIE